MKPAKNIVVLFIICLLIFIVPLNLVGCSYLKADFVAVIIEENDLSDIADTEYDVEYTYVKGRKGLNVTPGLKCINYIKGKPFRSSNVTVTENTDKNAFEANIVYINKNVSGLLVYDILNKYGKICETDCTVFIYSGEGEESYIDLNQGETIKPKFFCKAIPQAEDECGYSDRPYVEMDTSYGSYGDYFGGMNVKLKNINRGTLLSKSEVIFRHKKTKEVIHTGLKNAHATIIYDHKATIDYDVSDYELDEKNFTNEYEVDFKVVNYGAIPWHEFKQ